MTDDDTKFRRAWRERPHIEAFVRIIRPSDSTPETTKAPNADGVEGSRSMEAGVESPPADGA